MLIYSIVKYPTVKDSYESMFLPMRLRKYKCS